MSRYPQNVGLQGGLYVSFALDVIIHDQTAGLQADIFVPQNGAPAHYHCPQCPRILE